MSKLKKRVLGIALCILMLILSAMPAYAAQAERPSGESVKQGSLSAPDVLYGGDADAISDADLSAFINGYKGNEKTEGMESADLYVELFDAEYRINPDRSIDVTENIYVMFNEEMHGYFRTINTFGAEERYIISNITAQGAESRIEKYGDSVEIRLGSEDEYVEGLQKYVIKYKISYFADFSVGYDRIYQNIIPGELEDEVRNATIRIIMPDGAEPQDYRLYSGSYGSTSHDLSEYFCSGVMYIYANDTMDPYTGATVELKFAEGTFPAELAASADYSVDIDASLKIAENGKFEYSVRYKITPNGEDISTVCVVPISLFYGENGDLDDPRIDNVKITVNDKWSSSKKTQNYSQYAENEMYKYLNGIKGQEALVTVDIKGRFVVTDGSDELDFRVSLLDESAVDYTLMQVEGASLEVMTPAATEYNRVYCYSESENYYYDIKANDSGFTAELVGTLPIGEISVAQFTVPEGVITRQTTAMDIIVVLLGAAILVSVLFGVFTRKEKQVTPTMEFYPPEGLNPAEMAYIFDKKDVQKGLIALIYYWASKGYLTIEMQGKNKYVLHKIKDLDAGAAEYERRIFNRIWKLGDGESTTKKQLEYKMYECITQAAGSVKKQFTGSRQLWKKGGRSPEAALLYSVIMCVLLFVIPLVTFGICMVTAMLAPGHGPIELMAAFMAMVAMFFAANSACDIARVRHTKNSVGAKIGLAAAGVVVIALYALLVGGSLFANISTLLFAVFVVAAILLVSRISALTDYGSDITGKCIGFKQFLETAEKDRLEMLLESDPEYYYDILPYAQALGVSNVWTKKFEGIAMQSPTWFYGTDVTPMVVNSMMIRNMRSMENRLAMPEMSSSSSGSSFGGFSGGGGSFGGGFSGGGGGGGGGGGW